MVKIQSYSDVITNSSSELFVIKGTDEGKNSVVKLIEALRDVLDDDLGLSFEYAANDMRCDHTETYGKTVYHLNSDGWDYEYDKGDLIIESHDDNTIPFPIMELLEYSDTLIEEVSSSKRYHLG